MTEPISEQRQERSVLVLGAHGVVGRAVAEHFATEPAWTVTTAARRGPLEDLTDDSGAVPEHLSVDLNQRFL